MKRCSKLIAGAGSMAAACVQSSKSKSTYRRAEATLEQYRLSEPDCIVFKPS